MAKAFNPDSITKPGAHSTGEPNLYLAIASNGAAARSWSFRWHANGKTNVIGLGPIHTFSFIEAKRRAHLLRGWKLEGKDLRAEWEKYRAPPIVVPTFKECAKDYIKANAPSWKSAKHAAQWSATLETYAYPIIGGKPVNAVSVADVLLVLSPIWHTKSETATRVRQRIEKVLDRAKALGQRSGDNPAAIKGNIEHLLPQVSKKSRVKHHPSLPWQKMPAFLVELRKHQGQAALALELLILTATRSAEVRGACWSEFDLDNARWTIPAERMKAGVAHDIPLSASALELLRRLPRHAGSDLVFPSRKRTPLSDMTISAMVRGMNEPEAVWISSDGRSIVVHGFRGTFRTWAGEATNIPRDVCEFALAHQLPDQVEAAYMQSTLLPKRVRLMDEWAAWVTSPAGSVVPLRGAA